MIELTEQQVRELSGTTPPRVINPQNGETFVLVPAAEYARLTADYDDSPWTREEMQAAAWELVKDEEDFEPWDDGGRKP
jgi:hypothetical protein